MCSFIHSELLNYQINIVDTIGHDGPNLKTIQTLTLFLGQHIDIENETSSKNSLKTQNSNGQAATVARTSDAETKISITSETLKVFFLFSLHCLNDIRFIYSYALYDIKLTIDIDIDIEY